MSQRLNYFGTSAELAKKYIDFNNAVSKSTAKEFKLLVTIRASQINGCGFCLDMHVKEARIAGERDLRVHHIAIWHESTLFTPRECAALLWTEALTTLPAHGVSDETYQRVRAHLSEQEISDLSFLIMAINGWNRINVAFRMTPGSADAAYGLDKADLN
ncbi:carboxymuconolactone decarboxylase family protein [Rouxiella chamberiensis]|uniref:Carboxymuconolactone decarboxylase family protein n=1 Tax=Rouxiella chamberiensis TaxID=1513468 RepID=A0ABY7HQ09_9GAMM|nr:carboxymuconolactone decarboxylase family protein [Rouxiella chamberiensis]WAT01328.1 carboxymuconolactone decarboxylase family protein [Rouxiella chamberiensis]